MKKYPASFYNAINIFNNYEKQLVFEENEIVLSDDEEKDFKGFSAETESVMARDNADFATYLYNNCKPFRKNLDSYTREQLENIYINYSGSRFNCDCFDVKEFSEIENIFIEKYIDKNFAVERQFEFKNGYAVLYYYSKVILHNWQYTFNENVFSDIQSAFYFMNKLGYRFYTIQHNSFDRYYYFYKKGLTAKHHCKLSKAIEKEYGKNMKNMPCLIETDE